MKDIAPLFSDAPEPVRLVLNSLKKIEDGQINSSDMLSRMLMIEGSAAWRDKGLTSALEAAQKSFGDGTAQMSVDKSVYLHIAKKALAEAATGNGQGVDNARTALEKAFSMATGSLQKQDIPALTARLHAAISRLTQF